MTQPHTPGATSLLKLQLGPVHDFIAQARSTRDLWSGSYLLSWLMAAGIKALPVGSELIFPCRDGQPLLEDFLDANRSGILVPNLPNIFVAKIEGEAAVAAKQVKEAIQCEWKAIAKAVWERRQKIGLRDSAKDRFEAQTDCHLSIASQVTEVGREGYATAGLP